MNGGRWFALVISGVCGVLFPFPFFISGNHASTFVVPGTEQLLKEAKPSNLPPSILSPLSRADFIPPLATVLSGGWCVPEAILAEVAAEEGAVEVETEHTCLPGQGCALLRRYSLPPAS